MIFFYIKTLIHYYLYDIEQMNPKATKKWFQSEYQAVSHWLQLVDYMFNWKLKSPEECSGEGLKKKRIEITLINCKYRRD